MFGKSFAAILILIVSSQLLFANVGVVSALRGDATLVRNGSSSPLRLGSPLKEKDTILTADNTKVQLTFNDRTVITIGKNSRFSIDEYYYDKSKKSKVKFGMTKGFFRSVSGKIGKIVPQRFKLHTKNATIGIRGTEIVIEADPQKGDRIACTYGRIYILSPIVSRPVEVEAGHMVYVKPHEVPTPPVSIEKSDFTVSFTQHEKETQPAAKPLIKQYVDEAQDTNKYNDLEEETEEAVPTTGSDSSRKSSPSTPSAEESHASGSETPSQNPQHSNVPASSGDSASDSPTRTPSTDDTPQNPDDGSQTTEIPASGSDLSEQPSDTSPTDTVPQPSEDSSRMSDDTTADDTPQSPTDSSQTTMPSASAPQTDKRPKQSEEASQTTGDTPAATPPADDTPQNPADGSQTTMPSSGGDLSDRPSGTSPTDTMPQQSDDSSQMTGETPTAAQPTDETPQNPADDSLSTGTSSSGDDATSDRTAQAPQDEGTRNGDETGETLLSESEEAVDGQTPSESSTEQTTPPSSEDSVPAVYFEPQQFTTYSYHNEYGDKISYGYWTGDDGAPAETWFEGENPTSKTTMYYYSWMHPKATYEGGVTALTNGKVADGKVSMDFDFRKETFKGSMDFQAKGEPRWSVTMEGGVDTNHFSANRIGSASDSEVKDITGGTLEGDFYGKYAPDYMGGSFEIESSSRGTAKGVFGGEKR